MKTVSKRSPTDRTSARRHSTSTCARSPFRRAVSIAVRSESKPNTRPAPRSLAAIASTPFPHPRSAADRPWTSPLAEARYATSAAMPAGVGYCSVTAAGWGSGSRDSRIFSSRTFFVASPRRGTHSSSQVDSRLVAAIPRGVITAVNPEAPFHGPGRILSERAVDHLDRQRVEGVVNEGPGPGRGVDDRSGERFCDMPHLLLGDRSPFLEVSFVHDEVHRHVARDFERGGDPFVERVKAVLPREIAHPHQTLRSMVVRLPDEIFEPALAHDVEHRHIHLDLGVRAMRDGQLDLAHPGADRVEIRVLVFAEDEPSNQRGLPDTAFPHQGELCLHVSYGRHRYRQGSSFGARV